MARPESHGSPNASIGFEAKLWLTADKLRNNMDAAEPSGANRVERDSLHEVQPARAGAAAHGKQPARQGSPKGERGGANQYKAENVFWVPAEARWSHLHGSAKLPTIGKLVDDAMVAIERDWQRATAEERMWN